jgi:AcrR family transcriptional regulator
VGLREVAREAGLSKSALFHHFPSKVDLYAAVLERILGDLLDAIACTDDRRGPLARLLVLVETIVDALAASPTRAPLLLRSLFEGEVLEGAEAGPADALLARILGTAMEVMAEGVRSGELRPIPVPHALQAIVGMLAYHFASGELGADVLGGPVYAPAEIDRFKSFVVSFVEGGLAARPADSSTV